MNNKLEKKRLNFFGWLFRKLKKPRILADIALASTVIFSLLNYLNPSETTRSGALISIILYLIFLIWLEFRKAKQRWGRR